MSTPYPMYTEAARNEVDRRLRAAADEHRRRLARRGARILDRPRSRPGRAGGR
ncbi:MAG TPA: hypothetical protein VFT70_18510 [Nocardioides sp.]|nr:hypothetical protein [Nocardioides sp.]